MLTMAITDVEILAIHLFTSYFNVFASNICVIVFLIAKLLGNVFTARCTIVHRAILRSHVVRPSVRLSVTLVDQDHIGWKSWKLIARTICLTPSLVVVRSPKATHLLPGEHGEIWRRVEVGWKMAFWSTKAAISLKREKIEKSYYGGGPIGTHPHSFERYHPRPPTACLLYTSPSPRD